MWGGQVVQGATYRADGEIFDPASHRWSRVPDAPLEARSDQVAAWTGSRLLVWGGGVEGPKNRNTSFGDGASYDSATRRWSPMATAPIEPRILETGVWTGSRFLIWGGADTGARQVGNLTVPANIGSFPDEKGETEGAKLLSDGAAYDPSSNAWTPMASSPLRPRAGHVAVWTGREMLVWGGAGSEESGLAFRDGAAYKPATNTWRVIGNAPVHAGGRYTAVWTGKQMIVWGGPVGEGASYDPATNRWAVLPKSPLPSISTPSSVWTGRLMVIWGAPEDQEDPSQLAAKGAAFDPERDEWIPLAAAPTAPGLGQTAVWTGATMLVWGGFVGDGPFASGGTLDLRERSR